MAVLHHTRRSSWWHGIVVATVSLSGVSRAADWPQYRGPNRDGTTEEASLLENWGEGQPKVVWRQPIGTGYSSVTAVGDRVYTMDADGEREHVLCLDVASGETVWQIDAGELVGAELGDDGPRSTPTVVGGVVYAISFQARFMALDAVDGSLLWERDLQQMGPVPRFGYAVSPLVDGEVVLADAGPKEGGTGLVAFDRRSGDVRWTALSGPAAYSSPIAAEIDGVRQYVLFRAVGRELVGVSLSGEVLWRHPTPEALSALTMPIFQAPDRVFVSTSEDAFGGKMIRVIHTERSFATEEVWSERLMRNHFNTSVLMNGFLYGFDNGTLRCLDAASGERRWAKRGFGKGSLVAAGDRLFVLSDAGEVALVGATAEGYEEAGRLQVTQGRSWTAPSLANGRLYIRDFDEIVSLDVRGEAAEAGEAGEEAP